MNATRPFLATVGKFLGLSSGKHGGQPSVPTLDFHRKLNHPIRIKPSRFTKQITSETKILIKTETNLSATSNPAW
ncbi:MAG: hypothetical protein HOP33_04935 [Verrucomicrobia bacterium]|nr:hypothetical protein [Verrucomicrobiota bacterium]